jgi:hypothetical protein
MKSKYLILIVPLILLCVFDLCLHGAQAGFSHELLEKLLELPEHVVVYQFSSHNKKGLNGDENWPLYKDRNGDDVIFDASGPGCVKSMWGTNFDPDAILKFYFDGEKKPQYSISYIDFFKGGHPLFPSPLVSYERRGHWGTKPFAGNSFVPIPFENSLKIAIQGESRFFHIIYEKYPYRFPIRSFTGKEDPTALEKSFDISGENPFIPNDIAANTTETDIVEPGQEVILFKAENDSGLIREIVLDTDGSKEFFQDTWIQMRWDGHTHWDVNAPVGIFFGSAVEANDMRSLPLRVEKLESGRARLTCVFPMPYWSQAEIVWINKSSHQMGSLKSRIFVDRNSLDPERGIYFTALYRAGKTTYGRDWLLFESPGTGWFVGVVQSMKNAHYCEGDEHFIIDGALSPQINGTGSEDYYLACFWPNPDFDTPFGCVVGDIQKEGGGEMAGAYHVPSCYSRFHLEAPIPFYSSIDARIQHGGLSHIFSDYRSLAFCYLRRQPALRQSDFCDVGNPASESAHHYKATRSEGFALLKSCPEGTYFQFPSEENGRYHDGGEITFKVAVDPENRGVRLRRRLDQGSPCQMAHVYIDGMYAGCWYHGYRNEHLRWFESDFDIHPDFTAGKQSLDVKLVVQNGEGYGRFTDFQYKVYCFYQ